jgi:hypothetical protein
MGIYGRPSQSKVLLGFTDHATGVENPRETRQARVVSMRVKGTSLGESDG